MSNQNQNLEDYIRQVEAREGQRRRTMVIIACACVLVAALSIGYFTIGNDAEKSLAGVGAEQVNVSPVSTKAQLEYISYFAEDLTEEKIKKIFNTNNALIVLDESGPDRDTFLNFDAVTADIALMDLLAAAAAEAEEEVDGEADSDDEPEAEAAPEANTDEEAPEEIKIRNFALNVSGEPIINQPLRFAINNVTNGIRYSIDFGDGESRTFNKSVNHTYLKAGSYDIAITATSPTGKRSRVTKTIIVAAPEVAAPEVAEQPAAETAASEQPVAATPEPSAAKPEAAAPAEGNTLAEKGATDAAPASVDAADGEAKKVYRSAQKLPTYPGGQRKLYKYLGRKMRYPSAARDNRIEGKVYVQFVVDKDGQLTDIKTVKGIGYGCDEEAIRVVRSMPKWEPGEMNGEKVAVIYTLPINFKLAKR